MGAPVSALMSRMTSRSAVAAVRIGCELARATLVGKIAWIASSVTARRIVFVLVGVWSIEFVSQRAEYGFRGRGASLQSSDRDGSFCAHTEVKVASPCRGLRFTLGRKQAGIHQNCAMS